MPPLSEGAQEYVKSYGGWMRYLYVRNLDPTSRHHVEAARKFAEQEAVVTIRDGSSPVKKP